MDPLSALGLSLGFSNSSTATSSFSSPFIDDGNFSVGGQGNSQATNPSQVSNPTATATTSTTATPTTSQSQSPGTGALNSNASTNSLVNGNSPIVWVTVAAIVISVLLAARTM